jgi:hypothetical protein
MGRLFPVHFLCLQLGETPRLERSLRRTQTASVTCGVLKVRGEKQYARIHDVAVLPTAFAYRFCVRPTEYVARLCRIHNSAHGIVNAAHVSNKISPPPHR